MPVAFGRQFRLYAYTPSFSCLFLHSNLTDEDRVFVELIFQGVQDLKLPARTTGNLTVRRSTATETVHVSRDVARSVDRERIFVLQQDGEPEPRMWGVANGYVVADLAYYTRSPHLINVDQLIYSPKDRSETLEFVTLVD